MFRSIRSIKNLRGKVVLLRTDLNVESVKDSFKLSRALATIQYLRKKGAITLIMSHRGRPQGADAGQSLKLVVPYLTRQVGRISFIGSHAPADIERAITAAKPGSVLLLENVRFHKGEDECDTAWARQLASLGDLYVNDAFASHHPGATVSVLPKLLPAYVGFQMAAEVKALSSAMKNPRKPLVVVLAGGKAKDKFAVIKYLRKKAKTFLIGGVLANTFFSALGIDIDSSVVDEEIVGEVRKVLSDKKMVLPLDWAADGGKILDLGPLSVKRFSDVIAGAGTVIWNGPLGRFEDKRFKVGSAAIARAIAKSKAFSIVGGGETTSLILDLKLQNKIGFLSTGGGAMLAFLAGKPHAGLQALNYKAR